MTLNEAIEHACAVADSYKHTDPDCQCARDHRRLARWLTELKMARESAFAEIPQMARTISENHDLKAENAKLNEQGERLFGKVLELGTENAKLRKVTRDAWCLFVKYGAVHPCELSEVDRVRQLLQELGIEVE